MNRTNEIPSGQLKPEKPKSTQALLKQSNGTLKMAVQNIVPVNEVPLLANEIVTITSIETENMPTAANIAPPPPPVTDNGVSVCSTKEVSTSETEKIPETLAVPITQPNVILPASVPSTPPKIVQPSTQFVQVKAPTVATGRVQSPNVKNFFIRKGIEKQQPSQIVSSPSGTFITTQSTPSPQMSMNQLSASKKIIIKSQQILVPANKNTGAIIQVSGPQNISSSSTPITINANLLESSSADLSGILDLPILFADNSAGDGVNVIDQTAQILNASGASSILLNTSTDRNAQIGSPNIFISSADGKLPNRPVVISAAKISKPAQSNTITTTPTNNKVIFINRNQIKQQIVGSQTMTGTPIVKGLPTLKLMPTSLASPTTSTPITLHGNQITKLSPGTKIDLSTLKLVKNASPTVTGGIVKPLIINKAVSGTKNAIVIKSPMGANVQAHSAFKGNVLNRNITVRKVMNVVPGVKQIVTTQGPAPITTSVASSMSNVNASLPQPNTVTVANISPVTAVTSVATGAITNTVTPPKTTRKTRNSN